MYLYYQIRHFFMPDFFPISPYKSVLILVLISPVVRLCLSFSFVTGEIFQIFASMLVGSVCVFVCLFVCLFVGLWVCLFVDTSFVMHLLLEFSSNQLHTSRIGI